MKSKVVVFKTLALRLRRKCDRHRHTDKQPCNKTEQTEKTGLDHVHKKLKKTTYQSQKCLARYINTTSHIKWHLNTCTKQSSEDEKKKKKSVRISLYSYHLKLQNFGPE